MSETTHRVGIGNHRRATAVTASRTCVLVVVRLALLALFASGCAYGTRFDDDDQQCTDCVCGDGICNGAESAATCAVDCGSSCDGAENCDDGCPNDGTKTSPGACGCGVPDTDTDGDGVMDCNDRCPDDPLKIDPLTCGCGFTEESCAQAGGIVCWGSIGGVPAGDYVTISANRQHACALQENGNVQCWGYDGAARVSGPTNYTEPVIAMATGYGETAIINDQGDFVAWGVDGFGTHKARAGDFVKVAIQLYSNCAIQADQTLNCIGTTPPAGTYKDISGYMDHYCVLATDESVVCWGKNDYGQLNAPAGRYRAVSTGYYHSCLVNTAGNLTCFGRDDAGQVSNAPAGTFLAVSSGLDNSCALDANGNAVCWGGNGSGKSTPPAGTFTAIAVGDTFTCAISKPGG